MKRPVRAICLAVLVTIPAFAQQPDVPATKDDILNLFQVMDTHDQMREVMQQVIQQMASLNREELKRRHAGVSEEQLAEMDREFNEFAKTYPVDQLMADMVPVYQKHLSKADVDAMIAFYSSPTGKKLLHEMPAMTSEGIQAAYPRIQKNLDDIMNRVEQEKDRAQPGTAPQRPPSQQN